MILKDEMLEAIDNADTKQELQFERIWRAAESCAAIADEQSVKDSLGFYKWMDQYQDLSCAMKINDVMTELDLFNLFKEQNT